MEQALSKKLPAICRLPEKGFAIGKGALRCSLASYPRTAVKKHSYPIALPIKGHTAQELLKKHAYERKEKDI